MRLHVFIFIVYIASVCEGRGKYRNLIPNGYNVPNPCTADLTDKWARVGHVQQKLTLDVSEKTKFGEDFLAAKKASDADATGEDGIWVKLCPLDSDGDGRTNGVELGDKDCLWRKSNNDKSFDQPPQNLFHPGIPEEADGTLNAATRKQFCPTT